MNVEMNVLRTEIKNKIGIITLNSEKTLNALSLEMILQLKSILNEWKDKPEVACIFLQGAGEKAFCAGGDVVKLYEAMKAQRAVDATQLPKDCYDFFSNEYEVDYAIHTYPKPIIVWGHGIVMGGGIGLMVGASHRIVTERSKLAMPEITIGLYPDVGGTYFLNKMPSAFGLYLGLTGARLDGADCRYLGLADYYVKSAAKEELLGALESADWQGDAKKIADQIISKFVTDIPESQAEAHRDFVALFEGVASVEEFKNILESYQEKDDWINAGLKSFTAGSPSSAHIIFRQLNNHRHSSLEEVFASELNLSCQCCLHPDFEEGVRALLVDKDQNPKWTPATLDEVTKEWVDGYFEPIDFTTKNK